ncbi:unnamed protein product [Somion occarium]|uniref:Uncharacterized protein n=1 Tax=Somion occarium TaxID=3059160 RepID=A0ABP1CEP9_9APHY
MSFQHFRVPIAPHEDYHPGQDPGSLQSDHLSQAPSAASVGQLEQDHNGSYQYDLASNEKAPYGCGDVEDGYTLLFPSMSAFQEWKEKEEEEKMIEFVKGDTHTSRAKPPRFKTHTKLVCARHSRSGRKKYVKKYPDRVRKVPSRKLEGQGCAASISYKTYWHAEEIRVCCKWFVPYNIPEHSHPIGLENFPFTKRGRKAQAEQQPRRRVRTTNASTAVPPAVESEQSQSPTSPSSSPGMNVMGGSSSMLVRSSVDVRQPIPPQLPSSSHSSHSSSSTHTSPSPPLIQIKFLNNTYFHQA